MVSKKISTKNAIDVSKQKVSNQEHQHHKEKDPEIGSLIAFFTYLSFALMTLV